MASLAPVDGVGVRTINKRFAHYHEYVVAMVDRVRVAWKQSLVASPAKPPGDSSLILQFIVEPTGAIKEIRLVTNSTDETGVRLARSAVEAAAPFKEWDANMRDHLFAGGEPVVLSFHYTD